MTPQTIAGPAEYAREEFRTVVGEHPGRDTGSAL